MENKSNILIFNICMYYAYPCKHFQSSKSLQSDWLQDFENHRLSREKVYPVWKKRATFGLALTNSDLVTSRSENGDRVNCSLVAHYRFQLAFQQQ